MSTILDTKTDPFELDQLLSNNEVYGEFLPIYSETDYYLDEFTRIPTLDIYHDKVGQISAMNPQTYSKFNDLFGMYAPHTTVDYMKYTLISDIINDGTRSVAEYHIPPINYGRRHDIIPALGPFEYIINSCLKHINTPRSLYKYFEEIASPITGSFIGSISKNLNAPIFVWNSLLNHNGKHRCVLYNPQYVHLKFPETFENQSQSVEVLKSIYDTSYYDPESTVYSVRINSLECGLFDYTYEGKRNYNLLRYVNRTPEYQRDYSFSRPSPSLGDELSALGRG